MARISRQLLLPHDLNKAKRCEALCFASRCRKAAKDDPRCGCTKSKVFYVAHINWYLLIEEALCAVAAVALLVCALPSRSKNGCSAKVPYQWASETALQHRCRMR